MYVLPEHIAGNAAMRACRNAGVSYETQLREFFVADFDAMKDLFRRNPTPKFGGNGYLEHLEYLISTHRSRVEEWIHDSHRQWFACDKTLDCPGTLVFIDTAFFNQTGCEVCGKMAKCARVVSLGGEHRENGLLTCKACMNCDVCGKSFSEGNVASDEEWAKDEVERQAQKDV